MNELNTALQLLAVGMITVFAILSLVVLSGRMLILLINRWTPDPVTQGQASHHLLTNQTDKRKLAAIVAAVDIWTDGKGRITSIDSVNQSL